MNLTKLSIKQIIEGYKTKAFKPSEVVESYINNCQKNIRLNSYITNNFDKAIQQAKNLDQSINDNVNQENNDLIAIPIAIKDLFCTKNLLTTCGSKMLANFIPSYESTVTQKLFNAGAINLGKLNMDEFAMGSTNVTSYFGPVINPYKANDSDEDLVPGGSSGGSAAAVAASLCVAATGSDTGGSIRQPASFTNIVGVKPTYGRSSRYGMVAFASSLDQAGVFARNIYDAALMQKIISGYDNKDATSVNIAVPQFEKLLNSNLNGLKIGIPKEYRLDGMDSEIEKLWQDGVRILKDRGAEVIDISLPHTKYAPAVYYVIASAECSSNLARFDGVRYGFRVNDDNLSLSDFYAANRSQGFGKEVKRRIFIGTYVLSSGHYDAYYKKAQKVRSLITKDFIDAFQQVDAILTPATPNAAFPIDQSKNITNQNPVTMYLNDAFTVPVNLAGLPAISVPAGFNNKGLPLGLQIISKHFDEQTMFNVGLAIEESVRITNNY